MTRLETRHVWHPFTQMLGWAEEEPPTIVRGEGCFLFDAAGRRYLDGVSSLWCNVHGHRHPRIDRAIEEQLGRIAHSTLLGLRSEPADRLAERLIAIAPQGLRWVFYSDSGATAMEIALKMAFQYWVNRGEAGRTRFLVLEGAYHGDTIGSVSLGGIETFHRLFRPLLFHSYRAPSPHCGRCPLGLARPGCVLECAEELARLVAAHSSELAAVVVEPLVQGAAGMIVHPEGYLRRVREACDREGVLLVCDEVATGFGRTGRMFACEHEGVTPDLMAIAKGLTGGYLPLAATLATDRIFDAFLAPASDGKQLFHGHTYTGNALGCAAALASLEVFEQEQVIERLGPKIERLRRGLGPIAGHPHVAEVRQKGMMVGIELAESPGDRCAFDPALRMGHRVILAAREMGVVLRPLGDVVVLMPPLAISASEIDELLEVTGRAIDRATRGALR